MLYRDEAIVLRTHKLGEADRIITMLTRQNGRIRAVARGVRRTSSRWGSRLEPFTHVDLQLAQGRNLDTVTQAETRAAFGAEIGFDYDRYTAGTVMLETAERLVVEEREPAVQQFGLLAAALRAMASGERAPGHVLDSYLLRALAIAGYAPTFVDCAHCGRPPVLATGELGHHRWFNPSMGGVLCSTCRIPGSATPAPETLRLLGGLLAGDWLVVEAAEARHAREASGLVAAFVQWQLERGLRSLAYVER
ncbi:DNA repair protein RecO [Nocardioides sp. GY 10113]|uniref:DNA repair protein RecO n=1 Tax=Nocardioides sp. GY 10113 TaxID=2569761 RepID=UPI0010A8B998|nr:DNA repair protein RecO [Nocardioides sp. GY 10113]TIC84835.1 DNA repair protein RecO [Nocardioides sp. GY 10113]